MSSNYPGSDPDDPFAKPPNESGAGRGESAPAYPSADPWGAPASTEETAPIRPDEPGYWEKLAQEGAQESTQPGPPPTQPYGESPWGGYGQAASPGQAPGGGQGYPPPAYSYAQPAYTGYVRPSQPQATTALVLGLISLIGGFLTCGLLFLMSPFAWVVGARSKREIAASQGQLGGEGNAQAGFVMGIIGTVLLVLGIVVVVLFVVIALSSGTSTGFESTTDF